MPTLRVAMIVGLVAFVSAAPSPLNTDDRLTKLDSRIKHLQMEIGLNAAHGKDPTKATKAVAQALPKTVHGKESDCEECDTSHSDCYLACTVLGELPPECVEACATEYGACIAACVHCSLPWVTC